MQPVLAFLQRIWNVFKEYWQKTERKDRVRFIIISAVALIGVIVVVVLLTRVEYTVMYSDMEPADVGEVDAALTEMGVRHQISGNSVLVPAKQRDLLVARLANDYGYPNSGYTYDYLNNAAGFASSESEKRMWYIVDIQERLRASIKTNPLIKDARVIIAPPENGSALYKSEIVPVTASVQLTLLDKVSADQVKGIQALVASSWSNLAPENVTVNDHLFNLLSEVEPMQFELLASQEEMRLQVQSEFERAILALLTPMFGADHVRAKCNAVLDFDDYSSERITFSPVSDPDGIVVSMHRVVENATGGTVGEQVGEDGNGGDIPLYDETTSLGDTWNSTTETINYEVNQFVEEITQAKGGIKSLSASITIDSTNLEKDNSNTADIQAIVAGALGLSRADYGSINVAIKPFSGLKEQAEAYDSYLADLRRQQIFDLIRELALYIILGICLLVIIWRIFKLFHTGPSAEELLEMQRASELEELDEYADLVKLAAAAEDIETSKTPERMKVEDFVERSPDMVANLLRNWLMDDMTGRRR